MALRVGRAGRWTDRVEDMAAWVILAAGLLLVLFGWVLGVETYHRIVQQGQTEALERTPTSAVLLESAPTVPSAYSTAAPVAVYARWQDRSGMPHMGLVTAPQWLTEGSTVPIWIDRSGASVPKPATSGDALGMAGIVAGMVIFWGVTALAVLWAALQRGLMAYNCAAWEQEWREVAALWSRGEGKRG